jgi:hypothetical protein
MEKQSSPAALAARIARRQTDLAANVGQLKRELSPAALAGRAKQSARAEFHRLIHDGTGRLATPVLAALVGLGVLAVGAVVVRLVKR